MQIDKKLEDLKNDIGAKLIIYRTACERVGFKDRLFLTEELATELAKQLHQLETEVRAKAYQQGQKDMAEEKEKAWENTIKSSEICRKMVDKEVKKTLEWVETLLEDEDPDDYGCDDPDCECNQMGNIHPDWEARNELKEELRQLLKERAKL